MKIVVGLGNLLLEEGMLGGHIDEPFDKLGDVLHRFGADEHHLTHIAIHSMTVIVSKLTEECFLKAKKELRFEPPG